MKRFFLISLVLFFLGCSSETTSVRPSESQLLYHTDSIELMGQSAGLPETIRRVYITLFTDYSSTPNLQLEFDRQLRFHLQSIAAIRIENKIPVAQAVIEGKIDSYTQRPASRVTNFEGLLYQLKLTYSVRDMQGIQIQENKKISENILVTDTNNYPAQEVLPIILDHAARHTAQAILYGWQKEYQESPDLIPVLGEVTTNDLSTNR